MIRIINSTLLFFIAAACAASALAQNPPKRGGAPTSDDPVVRAMLSIKPKTPVETVRMAKILVDAREPALARPLVEQLVAKKLDDAVMAEIIDELGSAVLIRLGRVSELQPAAAQFAAAALDGAQRFARDPVRLKGLVARLKAATPYDHAVIVEQLRPAADAAVIALVDALADSRRADEHAAVRNTLVDLGPVAVAPCVAVLESSDDRLVADVIDVLRRLRDVTVADELLAPALAPDSKPRAIAAGRRALEVYFGRVPSPQQAADRLQQRARALRDHTGKGHAEPAEEASASPVWQWDDKSRQLTSEVLSPRSADLLAAVHFATAARRILPESQAVRRLYLSMLAQAIAGAGRANETARGVAAARSVLAGASLDDLEDVLAAGLDGDQPGAAAVAARLLGERGDTSLLDKRTPQPSSLARALSHPDRTLRFAALGAIMELNPRQPFPGASRVTEALEFFAGSNGMPRALVAAASAAEAGRIAGLLAELGYEPDAATSEAGVLRLAHAAGDYEVIFVDTALALPAGGQLLQRLRSDSRTAKIPVAIVSMGDDLEAARRLARRIPTCAAVMRTHNAAATEYELNRLLVETGRTALDREERHEQGLKALEWIAALASHPQRLYDLRRLDTVVVAALDAPGMTGAAITALAKLDTPRAQRSLVELASRMGAPIDVRQAAVQAFADSVAERGTLLTSAEILHQYDRYNASETQSVETQQVLGRILDTIEARAQAETLVQDGTISGAK